MTGLLPCPFCGSSEILDMQYDGDFWAQCAFCNCSTQVFESQSEPRDAWNTRAPVTVPAAAKPSTCCPGEHLVPMHSTDTKLCTGCKTEKHWPLEPGQKRTY